MGSQDSGADLQLVAGNSDELHGLAVHPTNGSLFASACDSGDVKLWDGRQRRLLRATNVGFPIRAVAFSSCGKHLAVGGNNGKLKIMKSDTLQPLCTFANAKSGITVLKYSPNNRILACGSHDLIVDIYDTGFRPTAGVHTGMVSGSSKIAACLNWEKDVGGTGCARIPPRSAARFLQVSRQNTQDHPAHGVVPHKHSPLSSLLYPPSRAYNAGSTASSAAARATARRSAT